MTVDQPDDPVAQALRMRASDADRERVAGVLREAYAEGRLTVVEHEERLGAVYRATTYGELLPVVADLPVPAGTLPVPTPSAPLTVSPAERAGSPWPAIRPELAGQGDGSLVAFFGGFERRGAWTVPPEVSALAVFGGGELDLSEAVLTSGETTITAICMFGGIEITVPAGVAVRSEAVAIFGGTEVPKDAPEPGAPVVIIKGAAIFGGIEVRRPKPPKRKRGTASITP